MHPLKQRASRPALRRVAAFAALFGALVSLVLAGTAAGQVTIGAEASFPGGYEFGGGESVASIGQVVTAPEGITTLEDFTLYPQAPPTFIFRAYVFAWNGTQTTGPALYESGSLHATEEGGFAALNIHTGGVAVTPGQRYVLFLSRSAEREADEGSTAGYALEMARGEGMFEPPPYTEGGLVTLSNGYEPAAWGTSRWSDFSFFFDAAFSATFDTPPPPEQQLPAELPSAPDPGGSAADAPRILAAAAAPQGCNVPYLGGLKLRQAKSALSAAGCSLGAVEHHYSSRPSGQVVEQDAHQGTLLPGGRKVGVWLSLGPHRRHRRA